MAISASIRVRVHRAELGCEGCAGAARHHDGRHDAADLARHRHRDQVGNEDGRSELLELDGADESQDQSNQEADQGHDAERTWAAVLHDEEEVGSAKSRAAAQQRAEREQALAEEGESGGDSRRGREDGGADPHQPWRP